MYDLQHRPPIIAGTDFTDAARAALEVARAIAEASETRLIIGHVYPGTTRFGSRASEELRRAQHLEAITQLERELAQLRTNAPTEAIVRAGDPAVELAALASESGAELLVIGASRAPGARWIGAVAAGLLDRRPCDLLIADRFEGRARRLLIPVDGPPATLLRQWLARSPRPHPRP